MKVEIGEVTRVSGGDFSVEFHVPVDTKIPIGAKVTVEWDENVHECEEMKVSGIELIHSKRFGGQWGLTMEGSKFVETITYCPGCGKKLGA